MDLVEEAGEREREVLFAKVVSLYIVTSSNP